MVTPLRTLCSLREGGGFAEMVVVVDLVRVPPCVCVCERERGVASMADICHFSFSVSLTVLVLLDALAMCVP